MEAGNNGDYGETTCLIVLKLNDDDTHVLSDNLIIAQGGFGDDDPKDAVTLKNVKQAMTNEVS